MAVKSYKPTSPGRRGMSVSDFSEITREQSERSLLGGRVNKSGGRNSHGHITVWQRGGGQGRLKDVARLWQEKPTGHNRSGAS